MNSKVNTLLLAALTLAGCASTPNNSTNKEASIKNNSTSSRERPSSGAELDSFKTEEHVINCLGQPQTITSKPDGRHTGLYDFKNGLVVAFLYNANGNLIRYVPYQKNL